MAFVAITVEGGLFPADLLDKLATTPEEVPGQKPADFGLSGGRVSEETQAGYSAARAYWTALQHRLATGKGSTTSITRDAFVIPLVVGLGYELEYQRAAVPVGGASFAISHRAGSEDDAPPVHIVAADQPLDERGSARVSPHAMLQDFLNRTDALWGIVTNGRRLRLLRDSARLARPTYLEVDLQAVLEGDLYNEFVVFYRLAHRSRFPTGGADAHACLLERLYQQGIEDGGRVREHLREGVERALLGLSTGFLAHPLNDELRAAIGEKRLDDLGFYRQLLRLIYRLLFLMVAEERKLLLIPSAEAAARQDIYTRWYSLARLRDRAEQHHFDDPHHDLWEGLKLTFRLFRDGPTAAQLNLSPLDGELFGVNACFDLEHAALANTALLDALFALSTFEETIGRGRKRGIRRRVNYAGLDVEELGSVYESLLDYHPHIVCDPPRFELLKGSERKTTGSYYTPPVLVQELIKSALQPVVEERLKAAESKKDKERALLRLKVIDPAAGSGHFLLAAARRIGRALAKVRTGEEEPAPAAYRAAVRDVIRHCIYAVDKNPLAVDLCKVALWTEGHAAGLPLSFLDHHIKCGDSLIGIFDLGVLNQGIPDEAYKPLTGDDKAVAKELKKRNQRQREGQMMLDLADRGDVIGAPNALAPAFARLAELDERAPEDVQAKAEAYRKLRRDDPRWLRLKRACDAWCAAFFMPLTKEMANRVPTTDDVWRCLAARDTGQGPLFAYVDTVAAEDLRFFHWPLEFPEVFGLGGFDVALGNPPWEVSQLSEEEFFSGRDSTIAAEKGAQRKWAIAELPTNNPALWTKYAEAKHAYEAANSFFRDGGRHSLTATGKINTYAIFGETFLKLIGELGRAGLIVPPGILSDDTTKDFFQALISGQRLWSAVSFENEEFLFQGIANVVRYTLLTMLGARQPHHKPQFAFYIRRSEQIFEEARYVTLSSEDIELLNPNTRTCPVFRSQADADLTKKIYTRVPVLIDESKGEAGNPWGIRFSQGLFNMTSDSGLFRTAEQLTKAGAVREGANWRTKTGEAHVPLYEAKFIWHYNHRFGSYHNLGIEKGRGGRGLPPVKASESTNANFSVLPRYWVSESEVSHRLASSGWAKQWLMGWRDVTSAKLERTVVASALPRVGVGHTLPLVMAQTSDTAAIAAFLANWSALVLDYVARQKVGGTHLTFSFLKQLSILSPSDYTAADLAFIVPRVLELTYTAWDMQPFARDLNCDGPPFSWDPDRRARLRAELDAYYAYLYGLSRDELRYILDPADMMGPDYPSETFRVLKEKEINAFEEYRTGRLVLEAYDRFAEDGTFDPARLSDARYLETVKTALTATKAQLSELERTYQGLLARADQDHRPTLFVEGTTDAKIMAAAWRALFPGTPQPFQVLAAEGTKNMGSLAGKGKALREILGNRLVFALADNDCEGRGLWDNKAFREGGQWRQHENGIWWCALKPTDDFRALMSTLKVDSGFWPFSIEACFSPALRRQAKAAGAWWFSDDVQSDLVRETGLAKRIVKAVRGLSEDDDAAYYLLAPHYQAKDAFAAWVTRPERLTPVNYAAFAPILTELKALIEKYQGLPSKAGATASP